MRDSRLIRGELLRTLRRHWAMPLFLVLLVGFVVVARGPVADARASATALGTGDGSLRTVSVWANTPDGRTPLTGKRIREIGRLPGVVAVTPYDSDSVEVYLADDQKRDDPRVLTLHPWTAAHPRLVSHGDSTDPERLAANEIVLADGFAGRSARQLVGREVVVLHTPIERVERSPDGGEAAHGGEPRELRLTIAAVHDDSLGSLDGPGSAYVNPKLAAELHAGSRATTVERLYATEGFDSLQVEVGSAEQVGDVQRQLREAGLYSASITSQLRALSPALSLLDTVGSVALWLVVGLALVFGLAMGTQRVRSRLPEIGLLKALGFSEGRIFRVLAGELFAVGSVAALLGVSLGALVAVVVSGAASLQPLTMALLLPLPGTALVVGALIPLSYARRLPPDSVLRHG
ncbi:ABC transporter permease [Streptomyces alkaliterrae]|nr:ABC transporter permease [Streptomyces alkaliterrae]MBB1259556.1 ABC transporter permease [Streptomyces alkaliterrae]